ncbi:cysteine desulfurase family protein [Thermodesulforhabdus norvegica]|uniref:cysteine desulfurase n=1 Tax=Thermodesulforhabdus norvegica TaxID=39841 RepID=A0A1I4TYG0_9BACT|nr:cysteine desulfurase family protein [Thermodesulforhabdus norvegica]SFM81615.1 cysteine desulfurase [Thermodesulforhabdus norvegica]
MRPIYLDYNATTPVDPQVLEAMLPFFKEHFGNPSSGHAYGLEARRAVEKARKQMACLLQCSPDEVIFTSGGTESNNTVLFGVAQALMNKGRHIVTAKIEHPSVLEPCIELMCRGFDVSFVPVDKNGLVDPDDLRRAIRPDTVLVSVMHANNEIGTIQPLGKISKITRERGILLHTDAAQSAGKIPVGTDLLGVDFMTIAGHKLYAPKGIGALYCKNGASFGKLMFGAGQERGVRPGTENVPYIVGLGEAADIAGRMLAEEIKRLEKLRNRLEERILEALPDAVIHGRNAPRLPNTLSVGFPGRLAYDIVNGLADKVAISAGAACHSRDVRISHVLQAIQAPEDVAKGTVRISLGRFTTEDEIDQAAEQIIKVVKK